MHYGCNSKNIKCGEKKRIDCRQIKCRSAVFYRDIHNYTVIYYKQKRKKEETINLAEIIGRSEDKTLCGQIKYKNKEVGTIERREKKYLIKIQCPACGQVDEYELNESR